MVKHIFRPAFTMIELIFAIVVIAIAVVSLPIMMQSNTKGIENNIAQEAIFAASVELMQATAGFWDANSTDDSNESDYARVINISGDCNSSTKLRPGHINQPYHRRCLDDTTLQTASNQKNTSFITLDDFNHSKEKLYIGDGSDGSGYKHLNYTSELLVEQKSDDNDTKILTVTVFDEANNSVTLLRTRSANIGEPQYYYRTF